jgi:hypothetical protein
MSEQRAKVKGAEGTFATIGPDHLWDSIRYIAQERLWFAPEPRAKPKPRDYVMNGYAVPARLMHGPKVSVPPMGSMS